VQANFVFGLDGDEGKEPFELTKEFVNRSPGAFPGYSLLTAFGRAAPLNLEYQKAGRVLPFPFHFLNNNHAMNVRPLNYSWPDFYDGVIDVTQHTFSREAIWKRFNANRRHRPQVDERRARVSSEGSGPAQVLPDRARAARSDRQFRAYFERENRRSRRSTWRGSSTTWARCGITCPRARSSTTCTPTSTRCRRGSSGAGRVRGGGGRSGVELGIFASRNASPRNIPS
jgi:hypothetical protein